MDLGAPLADTAAALEELEDVYLRDAVYFHDAKYAAHLNCPVVIPALVAEAVLSAVNSSMDTWDQSAGATMIERRLISTGPPGRLQLGDAADGVFTSGGSQSNFQALLIARNHAVAGLKLDPANAGLRLPALLEKLRIFTSADSHFSIRKSASMLGLGFDAVVSVPCADRTTGWTRPRSPRPLARGPERRPGADGGCGHGRDHRLRGRGPARRARRPGPRATAPGSTSTRPTAAG